MSKPENNIRHLTTLLSGRISTRILPFLALILFTTTTSFAQSSDFKSQARLSTAPANGKIAFTSNRDGNLEIYVMNADGTGQVRLTHNPGRDDFPAWSRDGRRIAFLRETTPANFDIYVMNANGTNLTPVTMSSFYNSPFVPPWFEQFSLSWSPDGTKIAFQEGTEIFTVNLDGSQRVNITSHTAFDGEPAWSPDGSRIAFVSSRNPNTIMAIHTMKPDGSDVRELVTGYQFLWDYAPDWSPDNRLAFSESVGADPPYLSVMNSDGTNRHAINFSYPEVNDKPKWSPDGSKIVFQRCHYDNQVCHIHVITADGSAVTQLTNTLPNNFHPAWQPRISPSKPADFDGDGKSDISVFRASDGAWYVQRSSGGTTSTQFGLSSDNIAPADYDGDGKTDIAVYRDGAWHLLRSTAGFTTVQFGLSGDIPQPADYDGDGQAELAVYRGGTWYTLNLANNQTNAVPFGLATDKPVAADYDGDGRADYAVYRDGTWHVLRSSEGFNAIQFGNSTDRPVVGDYDGDGKADEAVYRDGGWYQLRSQTGQTAFQFGLASDIPAPADYDGDGQTDAAVYRDGVWYLRQSTAGTSIVQFGLANDQPVPSAYVP